MGTAERPSPAPSNPPPTPADDKALFVVARDAGTLFDDLKAFLEDLGWVQVIEDRRDEQTLLPREGRQGTLYLAY